MHICTIVEERNTRCSVIQAATSPSSGSTLLAGVSTVSVMIPILPNWSTVFVAADRWPKPSDQHATVGVTTQFRRQTVVERSHRVKTVYECGGGHRHELCVILDRGVPPELRCAEEANSGWGPGGGGCPVPNDLAARVERQLRDDLQECRRRGYVLIPA